MKEILLVMLAAQAASIFAPCIEGTCFPRLREKWGSNPNSIWYKGPEKSHAWAAKNEPQVSKGDPCDDPAYKDAPFCQAPVFNSANTPIPIIWRKNKDYAVNPISNTQGGALELKPYNSECNDQKWIFTPVNEYNNLYYITNYATNLALTANGFASTLALQPKLNAQNQIFYVRPQVDGTFYISAYGSDLYMDGRDDNPVLYPILIIRRYIGCESQKWCLN